METLKYLVIEKSSIELEEAFMVAFPANEVLALIIEMADFQLMIVLLNLAWFLTYQIVLIRLTKTACNTTLH